MNEHIDWMLIMIIIILIIRILAILLSLIIVASKRWRVNWLLFEPGLLICYQPVAAVRKVQYE
jgi:hypothetical protein